MTSSRFIRVASEGWRKEVMMSSRFIRVASEGRRKLMWPRVSGGATREPRANSERINGSRTVSSFAQLIFVGVDISVLVGFMVLRRCSKVIMDWGELNMEQT